MTYKEFKALTDAYWLGWDNAQGTLDKDDVSHRSFLTLIQNIMMDEVRLKEGVNIESLQRIQDGVDR